MVATDLGNPFMPPILRGLEEECGARGYLAVVAETQERGDALRRICMQFVERCVDAIVITAAHNGDAEFISQLKKLVPVVLAVRSVAGGGHHTVIHDDVRGARLRFPPKSGRGLCGLRVRVE